jgi:hypothetical protein
LAKFIEMDYRGVAMYEDRTQDGRLQIHYRQDVEPILERCKELRNSGVVDRGIKNDMWHYAYIPPVVQMEWLVKYGVDFNKKDHLPAVLKLLNTDYKYLKTTDKHHMAQH